jgi:hypothetical protein
MGRARSSRLTTRLKEKSKLVSQRLRYVVSSLPPTLLFTLTNAYPTSATQHKTHDAVESAKSTGSSWFGWGSSKAEKGADKVEEGADKVKQEAAKRK